MKYSVGLFCCFVLLGLTACDDFFNRTYRYQEEIPLKPFVIKLTQTDYSDVGGNVALKIFLMVTNKSFEENPFPRSRFTLRIDRSHEVIPDPSFLEGVETDAISLGPGKNVVVIVPFILSKDALKQKFTLIVDRRKEGETEQLTLINVKDRSSPQTPPMAGKWHTARSVHWD